MESLFLSVAANASETLFLSGAKKESETLLALVLGIAVTLCVVFLTLLLKKSRDYSLLNKSSLEKENQLKRKLYEAQVLEELNERFGYSLNVERVVDTVISSLGNLISFSTVSYMLLEGNKLVFKIQLADSVSHAYIENVKDRMKASIKELVGEEVEKRVIEESVLGMFINDLNQDTVNSFFNIPLTVNGEFVGLLNVSSTKPDSYREPELTLLYKIVGNASNTVTKLYQLLEREKDKLESLVESMNDGVLMIDKDFRILIHNRALLDLLGIIKLKNVNIFDIVGAFSTDFPLEEKLNAVSQFGGIQTYSEVNINDRYFQINIIPVKTDDSIAAIGVLVQDQTKEMELKKLREDFTAMMVHELRAPLTVIKGAADLLLKQIANLETSETKDLLTHMHNSACDLLSIVNNLLDVAKVEAGRFEVALTEGDLNRLIQDQTEYFRNLANQKNVSVIAELDESVKVIKFDAIRLKQVMNNLISNAIKFTESGGYVRIVTNKKEKEIEIAVIDNGKGLSEEMKKKLFEKFSQGRTSLVSNEPGTGLGLVVAKGVIEAHGGRIWVEDNMPRGAKFIFTLPF